jgi:hypothetical protein
MKLRQPIDLRQTTLLRIGQTGVFDAAPFTLSGRRCVQGRRGAIWNEWSMRFDYKRPPTFLAENAGSFTVYREGDLLPPIEELNAGSPIDLPWVVVERGTATRLEHWGDVDELAPTYEYVDFSSKSLPSRRATLADGETFIGTPMPHNALGLDIRPEPPALIPTPNVSMPSGIDLWLGVGDKGTLDGIVYQVVGVVARSRADARWEEYCVYSAGIGVRWLVVGEGHWSLVSPIEPGQVALPVTQETAVRVDWVTGELPWSAELGEHIFATEHGALVGETDGHEVSWSQAKDLTTDDVARGFNKRNLPLPR